MSRRPLLLAAAAVVALGAIAGCSTPTSRGQDLAQESVQWLLEPTVFDSYAPDIVVFAEHAEQATEGTGILLVAVEDGDTSARSEREAIGWLTFGLSVADRTQPTGYWEQAQEMDPGPYCSRVAFDHWGVFDIRGVDCPDPLVAVPAPPSQRPQVAANAEEAVRSVLSALPEDLPPEEEIVAEVTALLDPHPNGVTPLAVVTAHVEGTSVAVATGDGDDCVLVGRFEDGVVRDVHVPSVYLQVGELGCVASTAFADLRPPH